MAQGKDTKVEDGANEKSDQHPRVRGSEVFVGGLARTVTEDMIREVFSTCGEVVEIRMMKDQNGALKGYCFVRFASRESAVKAQKEKNGITLQGKKIGVAPSTDQDVLFLGNLRKDWGAAEVESMVRQAFPDVVSVELAMPPSTGESPADKKRQNRGFAFVHFVSHAHLARAFPFIAFSATIFLEDLGSHGRICLTCFSSAFWPLCLMGGTNLFIPKAFLVMYHAILVRITTVYSRLCTCPTSFT